MIRVILGYTGECSKVATEFPKLRVVGSIPTACAMKHKLKFAILPNTLEFRKYLVLIWLGDIRETPLAQLVEHLLSKR